MTITRVLTMAVATAMVLTVTAVPARAQAKTEVGVSAANLTVGLGDSSFTTFGVPSSLFGLASPGVYASIFTAPKISIDPRIGLFVISGLGDTEHVLNLGGQVNYFTKGTDVSSPYVFGDVGLIDVSDDSIVTFGGGGGYRFVLGDRLTLRADGRLTHYSEGGGNSLSFTLSLGGLFGKK